MAEFYSENQFNTESSWKDLVIFLSDGKYLNEHALENWRELFHKIIVLVPRIDGHNNSENITFHTYDLNKTKVQIWNDALTLAESDWVLFIEDDEQIQFQDFPTQDAINEKLWPHVLIQTTQNELDSQYYQTRFVNRKVENIFNGKNLPDCSWVLQREGIKLTNQIIQLYRKTDPFEGIDVSEELAIANFAPQVYLIEGRNFFKQRKYVHAAAQYRQLLKMKHILPFDKLAAINGLASCATEQFKWEKALSFTGSSLSNEPLQKLPYLIEFRIYQLQRKWKYAYKALNRYYECSQLYSRAGFDISISEEEALVNLADLSFKMGDRASASEHLDALFYMKNGNVQPEFLKRLLLLCIELKDLEKSKLYFHKMFDSLPDISQVNLEELHEFMGLFIKNEWFEYVYEIYNDLYHSNPKIDEFRRRLIVASMKTKRLKQAKELALRVA